jgi:4-hydroxy-tetrahydrodipicolinate synthase
MHPRHISQFQELNAPGALTREYNERMTIATPAELPARTTNIEGVIAAAVTPLNKKGGLELGDLPRLIDFLAGRGCHGVLMLGTTGEGPSFSVQERIEVVREAVRHREAAQPNLKILAGTGCASLADTIELTRTAFEAGVDAVVTLPAFYYKGLGAEGITAYFERVVGEAVPAGGRMLLYHIPQVSGVAIPPASIRALRERFPDQAWGMKDSQDDLAHTLETTGQFPDFHVFAGSDSIMTESLAGGASGSITALANITSPLNRAVWEAHRRGATAPEAQAALIRARQAIKGLSGPAAMKAGLADLFHFPEWPVRPPLEALRPDQRSGLRAALRELMQLSS